MVAWLRWKTFTFAVQRSDFSYCPTCWRMLRCLKTNRGASLGRREGASRRYYERKVRWLIFDRGADFNFKTIFSCERQRKRRAESRSWDEQRTAWPRKQRPVARGPTTRKRSWWHLIFMSCIKIASTFPIKLNFRKKSTLIDLEF